jgi:hypothetical protein
MPFRKAWRKLVLQNGRPNRRLYETAVLATLRDKLRSGDVWVECSANYRRFDSYLLPPAAVPKAVADLGLPASADEWLASRRQELDKRLRRFAESLRRGTLDGVEKRDEQLHVTPVKASAPPDARGFADRVDALLPVVRITELPHERPASRLPSPTCARASVATTTAHFSPQCWPTRPISVLAAWPPPAKASAATS